MCKQRLLGSMIITSLLLVLIGCASTQPRISASETYRGALVAALLPIEGTIDDIGFWLLRERLEPEVQEAIVAAGTFAAFSTIKQINQPNEADVLLLLRMETTASQPALYLRAHNKTDGRVELERRYRLPQGAVDDQTVAQLARTISQDVHRRFRR